MTNPETSSDLDDGEAEILAEQVKENMELIDWISDKIGLPHDVELSRSNFTDWLERLTAERASLRKIISECAAALPNGAFVSPDASIEFMAILPVEIKGVCAALTKGPSNG